MKKEFVKSVFIVGCIALCLSCTTKTYDIDIEGFKPRLVLQCFFNEGELFVVYVTSTMKIDSKELFPDTIENAEVNLYKDGVFQERLVWNDQLIYHHDRKYGVYSSNSTLAESGSTYRLEVSAPGFDPVVAESAIPEKTQLEYLSHNFDSRIENIGGIEFSLLYLDVYLRMQNPHDIRHFYFFVSRLGSWRDLFAIEYPKINDPILGNTNDLLKDHAGSPDYLVFSNEFIQTEEYDFTAEFLVDNTHGITGDRLVYFNLATLSQDAYKYMSSRTYERNIDQRFSEPIWVYTNVEGGAGIFAGVNISTDSLIFPIYFRRK